MEAIWGLIREEAESVAKDLNIPYSTTRIDDVLLRKGHFLYDVLHLGVWGGHCWSIQNARCKYSIRDQL